MLCVSEKWGVLYPPFQKVGGMRTPYPTFYACGHQAQTQLFLYDVYSDEAIRAAASLEISINAYSENIMMTQTSFTNKQLKFNYTNY